MPNNQLDDDHSDELSKNQLTHNQQPDMTVNCNNMLPNDISNHESQLISNIPQPVTTTNHTTKVDDNVSNKLKTMPNKLPLKGDSICYKNTDLQWINAVILGHAGKSTGKYKHWYNVPDNDLPQSSVNLDAIH